MFALEKKVASSRLTRLLFIITAHFFFFFASHKDILLIQREFACAREEEKKKRLLPYWKCDVCQYCGVLFFSEDDFSSVIIMEKKGKRECFIVKEELHF